MRYADNQPVEACKRCLERIERQKCGGCEARTLNRFIVWGSVYGTALLLFFAGVLVAIHYRWVRI